MAKDVSRKPGLQFSGSRNHESFSFFSSLSPGFPSEASSFSSSGSQPLLARYFLTFSILAVSFATCFSSFFSSASASCPSSFCRITSAFSISFFLLASEADLAFSESSPSWVLHWQLPHPLAVSGITKAKAVKTNAATIRIGNSCFMIFSRKKKDVSPEQPYSQSAILTRRTALCPALLLHDSKHAA
jgi:hypothetical protein